MALSRREFLACSASMIALPALVERPRHGVIELLDLAQDCRLRESITGYTAALSHTAASPSRSVLIVPAAGRISPPAQHRIVTALRAGDLVVLESAAGFADREDVTAQRQVLCDALRLRVLAPVPLWPRRSPYVDYYWPSRTMLRDFSWVTPLADNNADVIARADDLPVALRRQMGQGTLIFLGSPLGPALWAGDADARSWLAEALRS
ncbi:MAG TPA: hypothetical protein VG454_14100 [Gemmatimonadales bacterium]|nr:hypothetical protein [Gemmatimonadales bacterium]